MSILNLSTGHPKKSGNRLAIGQISAFKPSMAKDRFSKGVLQNWRLPTLKGEAVDFEEGSLIKRTWKRLITL